MSKKLALLLGFLFLLPFIGYAQEIEEDFNDFDDIFFEAQDIEEAVITESSTTTSVWNPFSVSGTVNANLGIVGNFVDGSFSPGGYLGFEGAINLTISPNDSFSLCTGITENLVNFPSISLNSLYFNYLFLRSIFISAGVRGVTWGYTRLFCDLDKSTNIMADSGGYVICQIQYPWSNGTLTFIPMLPIWALKSGNIGTGYFEYALSAETVLFNTSFNLFTRMGGSKKDLSPLLGFETKKTILGFDVYGQSYLKISDIYNAKSNYITSTFGLYRLWDAFDPNVGFNFEYQFTRRNRVDSTAVWEHLIAFEGGIKRLGVNKNHKIGLQWQHDIMKCSGFFELAYLISGIFPYADWSNACNFSYSKSGLQVIKFGTAISLDLSF